MSTSPLRHNLRHCTYDGIAATPIVYLLQPGNFIMAALLVELFHLPPTTYGVIASLPFWGNFTQAFLMPLVNRSYSPKAVSVASSLLQAICWGAMAVMLSFLPVNQPEISGRWFITFFAISAGVTALTGVSWMSWVQEWVPVRLRGKYFGRRNRFLQVAQLVFLLLVGWVLGKFSGSVRAFQILLGCVVVARIGSVLFQRQIKAETPVDGRAETKLSWRDQATVLFATKPFLWLIAYGAAWGFAASTFGPFYTVFMYKDLGLSVQDVSTIIILSSIGGAASAPAWGSLADRFGSKPVMLFCMIAWQVQNFLWCVLTPTNSWLLYGMWTFGGAVGTGFTLALFNLQLKIIPPHAKTLAISANLAITSLVTAIGPIIGGEVLQHLLHGESSSLVVHHRLFLVQPTLGLLACLLLTRIHERAASPLSSVVGAMRNVRTLTGIFGVSILMDYIFIKPQPTAKQHPPVK